MSRKRWLALGRLVLAAVLAAAVTGAFWIAMYGIPLWGVPIQKEVESVRIEFSQSKECRILTEPEQIELAVKLLNKLNYQPFTQPSESSEQLGPDVTITCILRDGREVSAGANWITGWWKGKAHALKEPDLFVNLAEGLFLKS